ncbi:RidA family protein [Variovorax terrae]|uniref:RidA family protein n=1 Tax=Variovorax terrae TaxID=2923278 RepID=A0A9X1VYV3_9BURK|nr:RidA family protein [Variovorax terrae]MCJ0766186.1 RidA family protein [Variovorax terrae]
MSDLIQYLNPPTLARPNGFSHLTEAAVDRLVFISGQVSYDPDGNIVGAGDLAAQTRQVFINLGLALEAAGTAFDHVVKLNFFVRSISESAVATIRQVRKDFLIDTALPASTMVGVAGLAKEALLLEVEAYALKKRAA